MDSRSNQKVERRIRIIVYILLVGFVLMLAITIGSISMMQALKEELLGTHPELTEELLLDFSYYERQVIIYGVLTVIIGCVLLLICGFLFTGISHGKQERMLCNNNVNLLKLQNILDNFQRGNYELGENPFIIEENKQDNKISETWSNIENSLQITGYYFKKLKEDTLQEYNNTKGFITDVSHQLKTPLASLRMSFDLVQESSLSEEEKYQFIKQEEKDILRLEQLMEELVNVSRLESGMITITTTSGTIQELLGSAIEPLVQKAKNKGIELQVECLDNWQVDYDPKWTVEAVSNVLDNAIKYSRKHTEIQIRVSKLPSLLILEVEDEGIGITKAQLHQIFKRFYRGTEAKKMDSTGAGVGLYLTRYILEQQGGTITAKRKENGTIFRLTLPLQNCN